MTFGADYDIGFVPLEVFQKHGEAVGVNFTAGVNKGNVVAFGLLHTDSDGMAFALVFLVHQSLYRGRNDLFDSPVGAVAEAVNNDYYFVRVSDFFKGIFQSFYISDDCFGLAVRGDNNGKKVVITVGHGNKTAADGF